CERPSGHPAPRLLPAHPWRAGRLALARAGPSRSSSTSFGPHRFGRTSFSRHLDSLEVEAERLYGVEVGELTRAIRSIPGTRLHGRETRILHPADRLVDVVDVVAEVVNARPARVAPRVIDARPIQRLHKFELRSCSVHREQHRVVGWFTKVRLLLDHRRPVGPDAPVVVSGSDAPAAHCGG